MKLFLDNLAAYNRWFAVRLVEGAILEFRFPHYRLPQLTGLCPPIAQTQSPETLYRSF